MTFVNLTSRFSGGAKRRPLKPAARRNALRYDATDDIPHCLTRYWSQDRRRSESHNLRRRRQPGGTLKLSTAQVSTTRPRWTLLWSSVRLTTHSKGTVQPPIPPCNSTRRSG